MTINWRCTYNGFSMRYMLVGECQGSVAGALFNGPEDILAAADRVTQQLSQILEMRR